MVEKANNSNSLIYSIKIALIIIATLDNVVTYGCKSWTVKKAEC